MAAVATSRYVASAAASVMTAASPMQARRYGRVVHIDSKVAAASGLWAKDIEIPPRTRS